MIRTGVVIQAPVMVVMVVEVRAVVIVVEVRAPVMVVMAVEVRAAVMVVMAVEVRAAVMSAMVATLLEVAIRAESFASWKVPQMDVRPISLAVAHGSKGNVRSADVENPTRFSGLQWRHHRPPSMIGDGWAACAGCSAEVGGWNLHARYSLFATIVK